MDIKSAIQPFMNEGKSVKERQVYESDYTEPKNKNNFKHKINAARAASR